MRRLCAAFWFAATLVFPAVAQVNPPSATYSFHGTMSEQVLHSYLARALQFPRLLSSSPEGASPYFEDDLRVVRETGAKFIGRAAYAWWQPLDEEEHFAEVASRAKVVHAQDREIILQAAVFETTHLTFPEARDQGVGRQARRPGVETIPIPPWVLEAFDQTVTSRTFSYGDMLFSGGRFHNHWMPGASVPDITRLETRMWYYYYRACRYIAAGCEALHLGQMSFTGTDDTDGRHWRELMAKIRSYAATHARRGYVLLDAHALIDRPQFLLHEDKLLLDFLSWPLRPEETSEPLQARLRVGRLDTPYARAPGGLHPGGWRCRIIPQLYEFDNCLYGLSERYNHYVWGADESTWFANLPGDQRDSWLHYAHDWIWNNAPGGHLQMPGSRPAAIPVLAPVTRLYLVNNKSTACPEGSGQEGGVKAIWNDPLYRKARPLGNLLPVPKHLDPVDAGTTTRSLDLLRELYRKHGRQTL